jgi:hypothetical protein
MAISHNSLSTETVLLDNIDRPRIIGLNTAVREAGMTPEQFLGSDAARRDVVAFGDIVRALPIPAVHHRRKLQCDEIKAWNSLIENCGTETRDPNYTFSRIVSELQKRIFREQVNCAVVDRCLATRTRYSQSSHTAHESPAAPFDEVDHPTSNPLPW